MIKAHVRTPPRARGVTVRNVRRDVDAVDRWATGQPPTWAGERAESSARVGCRRCAPHRWALCYSADARDVVVALPPARRPRRPGPRARSGTSPAVWPRGGERHVRATAGGRSRYILATSF